MVFLVLAIVLFVYLSGNCLGLSLWFYFCLDREIETFIFLVSFFLDGRFGGVWVFIGNFFMFVEILRG